jgi:hypothetical protein
LFCKEITIIQISVIRLRNYNFYFTFLANFKNGTIFLSSAIHKGCVARALLLTFWRLYEGEAFTAFERGRNVKNCTKLSAVLLPRFHKTAR